MFSIGQARRITCLDRSETVLEAARRRLEGRDNVDFAQGDLLEARDGSTREVPFEDI